MIQDYTLDKNISINLTAESDKNRKGHIPSGKLSASALSWPLQWQILHVLGVPQRTIDAYTLRKFLRGNHVEDWLLTQMKGVTETQKPIDYKGCIGLVDAVVDHHEYDNKLGVVPHEIKSVSNFKYKHLTKNGEADHQHKLQAGLYALATESRYFAIDYVATDDYRVLTFIYEAEEMKLEIESIINEFGNATKDKIIPRFTARYDWQSNSEYNHYPEFMNLNGAQILSKIELEYPENYKLFMSK